MADSTLDAIRFVATREELRIITAIVERADAMADARGMELDFVSTQMDIEAVHCNDVPLNLAKLLAFDDSNFAHDVFGIIRHIDRNTGKLTRCFLPRCAVSAKERVSNA